VAAVTGSGAIQVAVCACGLGTRIAGWSRYVPKEFYPVGGRPGIVHLLDEIARAARLRPRSCRAGGLTVRFITQHRPYADLTSVVNGADHLASADDLYVAFADNLYPCGSPLTALRHAPAGVPG